MAGYSETPLVNKLGIKVGFRASFINAPRGFSKQLDLPPAVKINSRSKKPLDFVLLFVERESDLRASLPQWVVRLSTTGMLWVAWPKKSSGIATDLSFNNVQAIGLAEGLVDTKICAVDEIWSGLKFVFRLKDRARIEARRRVRN
jgi:hypothetical protein